VKNGRRTLLAGILITTGLALWIAAVGGVQWRVAGVALRARDPLRPMVVAVALLAIYALRFRSAFVADAGRVERAAVRAAGPLALTCAVALAASAWIWGTRAASGSDPFGYISQAYSWLHGALPRPQPLPATVPWPSAAASLAPLGYRPAPGDAGIVPTYSPGLPLIMAALTAVVGARGPYLIVPLSAGALVWITFLLGRRVAGAAAGGLAAVFVAASPVVMFQSLWPMSDVPVAALWTGAALVAMGTSRTSALSAGLLAAVAVLVRPNLWFIPPSFAVYFLVVSPAWRHGLVRAALFGAPVAVVVLAIAALNNSWYGGPLRSGYGTSDVLYSLGSVWPNLQRYPAWLVRSHSVLVLLFLAPVFFVKRAGVDRHGLLLSYLLIGATWLCYLAYFSFEEWWYLRFLLPAIPATLVLVAVTIRETARGVADPWGRLLAIVLAAVVLTSELRFGHAQQLSGLRQGEDRYVEVGLFVKDTVPANGIVLAIQHSGSVRFYSGRPTVRYDLIDEAWVARAGAALVAAGYRPYAVFEDWELPQVRGRLGLRADETLPWRLVARLREPVGVNVFALAPDESPTTPVALSVSATRACVAPSGY
jgi:hypothetical protein